MGRAGTDSGQRTTKVSSMSPEMSPWYWLAALAVIWRGFWIGVGISAWMTLINELVPENLLSRVLSFDYFGSFALTPVGFVIAGKLIVFIANCSHRSGKRARRMRSITGCC